MQYAGSREDNLHSRPDPYTISLSRRRSEVSRLASFELLLEQSTMLDTSVNMRRF